MLCLFSEKTLCGFELSLDTIDNILGKDKIYSYLTQPYIATLENWDWKKINNGIIIHTRKPFLELINSYIAVRDNPEDVIEAIKMFGRGEEEYYRVRELDLNNNIEKAARFIYLNHTSYNGIYRVNKRGKYNVPYGKRDDWVLDEDKIRNASKKLRNTNIQCGDFTCNKWKIKAGDLVFLDPPYTVSHNNNGFIEYNQTIFALKDQYRLSEFIDYIKRKDAYYVLTNAAHDSIKQIFEKNDRLIELDRKSLIGGKNASRGKITEYIFTNIVFK